LKEKKEKFIEKFQNKDNKFLENQVFKYILGIALKIIWKKYNLKIRFKKSNKRLNIIIIIN
jgi:hypothetical protein